MFKNGFCKFDLVPTHVAPFHKKSQSKSLERPCRLFQEEEKKKQEQGNPLRKKCLTEIQEQRWSSKTKTTFSTFGDVGAVPSQRLNGSLVVSLSDVCAGCQAMCRGVKLKFLPHLHVLCLSFEVLAENSFKQPCEVWGPNNIPLLYFACPKNQIVWVDHSLPSDYCPWALKPCMCVS